MCGIAGSFMYMEQVVSYRENKLFHIGKTHCFMYMKHTAMCRIAHGKEPHRDLQTVPVSFNEAGYAFRRVVEKLLKTAASRVHNPLKSLWATAVRNA